MIITWTHNEFGRQGELEQLNRDRNNPGLDKYTRKRAEDALKTIIDQLNDRKLMDMRLRLIRAAQAGDLIEQDKIAKQMKAYNHEDLETGL